MNKEQLIQAQIKIGEYRGPSYLKDKYNRIAESAIADIADREIREMCGDISELTAKKSGELIRRINTMPLDETAKSRYIDALDAHIASLKEQEQREYIEHLTGDMSEYGINAVHLAVPGMTGLFINKYDNACNTYVSVGRYELPILIHEGNGGDSFTMTTEYLYTFNRGVMKRIKVDDIASFQAKKTLMNSVLTAVEKNGDTSELPNSLKKDIIENVAKTLTALVSFIHDRRSAEHMKELLENAVQEKAVQAAAMGVPAAAPVGVHVVPVPVSASARILDNADNADSANDSHAAYETEYRRVEPHISDASEEPAAVSGAFAAEENVSAASVRPVTEESAVPAENEIKIKFCDQCGAKITSPTAKFCAECGNRLM